MKIIVTGGAGFIGSNLVDRLLEAGAEVLAVDNFDPFYDRAVKEANVVRARRSSRYRLVELDIRDAVAVEDLVSGYAPDVVAHLAAKAGVRPSIADPRGYSDVNIGGTVNWLQAACRLEPRPRFVFASSSSVYGDTATAPFSETEAVDRPVSPYAATKRACELIAYTFHHLHGLPVTGLRFFTAFGPRNRPDLAIAKFTRQIDRGEAITVFGDGSTRRDYTFIDDIVDGIVAAIEHCRAYHIYNLGRSDPVTLSEMIDVIATAVGKPPIISRQAEQPGDVRQTFADIGRARSEIGYDPGVSFQDGIERYVAWYRKEGH